VLAYADALKVKLGRGPDAGVPAAPTTTPAAKKHKK
jgi:hypothetical protein